MTQRNERGRVMFVSSEGYDGEKCGVMYGKIMGRVPDMIGVYKF